MFRPLSADELAFVSSFRKGELHAERGDTILMEGSRNPHLYTVLSGWAFRYKLLPDGRRQVVNFAMPGDLVGLQGTLLGEMQHSVEALSAMTLCVFERQELMELYRAHPDLGYDVTWIASREECILDENLLAVGRRTARERLAYLIGAIAERGADTGVFDRERLEIPITQQLLADALGLSLVHTNKTARRLAADGLLRWSERGCHILDLDALQAIAKWRAGPNTRRPFI